MNRDASVPAITEHPPPRPSSTRGRGVVLTLAYRQLRRDFAAGEVRILLAALVLAVLAVSTVGFITDRAERTLAIEANHLLGGDAMVTGDTPLDEALLAAAHENGLAQTQTVGFRSMVRIGEAQSARLQLGDLRAVGKGFPLRGRFRITDADGVERDATGIPEPGAVWLSRSGAETLDARIGDVLTLGEARFTLTALVIQEPDAVIDYFNVAPKVFLNLDDLPSTGLMQEGSRARWRLIVAGQADAVERFIASAHAMLQRGQRVETIADARPEVRSALDRAGQFLGLAALIVVMLAAIAVAMAARQYSQRHLSDVAVMRCLGAQQRTVMGIYLGELTLLGFVAGGIGVALAFALQWAAGGWLAAMLNVSIPAASIWPGVRGMVVGLVVLLAFAAPPVLTLRRVPALRVLRRDLGVVEPSAVLVTAAGLGGLVALLWWQAGSAKLAATMLGGIALTFTLLALLAWAMMAILRRLRAHLRGPLRYGLANLGRHTGAGIAQISSLGLGLMALLLLTFVRTDLLERWQLTLGEQAPNRFIINVQDDQVESVHDFIAARGLGTPTLLPMIRARLIEHNGQPVRGEDYIGRTNNPEDDARNRRRAEREFNLSMATVLNGDNTVTAGRFWQGTPATPELSVEDNFARSLGWNVGDVITFDITGQRFEAPITSLRRVEWERLNPNFFVLASPGALDSYPASHITALHIPASDPRFTAELVQRFPNLSVVDLDAVLSQIRKTTDQVSVLVQAVFWFALIAGVLVLLAAINASQDERLLEGGVMRALGASQRQLRLAQISEFAAIGLLAGMVAAMAASLLSAAIAEQVLNLPWAFNPILALTGTAVGVLVTGLAGLWATRHTLVSPPAVILRQLQA